MDRNRPGAYLFSMRSLFLFVVGVLLAAPASAQVLCEGSADNSIGEALATYTLDGQGQPQRLMVSFLPERMEGVGQESDYFARPRVLFDYRMNDAGDLAGPVDADVMVTRFANPGAGKAPPMSAVQIRGSAGAEDKVSWAGNDSGAGERRFADLVREKKPAKVKVDILDKSDKVLASAEFDLSKTAEMQKLAAEAKADADKRLAAFQKAIGEGKAPKGC
jgi:hypothetical protein